MILIEMSRLQTNPSQPLLVRLPCIQKLYFAWKHCLDPPYPPFGKVRSKSLLRGFRGIARDAFSMTEMCLHSSLIRGGAEGGGGLTFVRSRIFELSQA